MQARTWRLKPHRFSELADLEAEPDWVWKGIVGREQVTMLSGKAFDGKSTLLLGLLAALETGESFLGLETKKTSALLLTETNRQALRSQASRFGFDEDRHQFLTPADGLFRLGWEELVTDALEIAVDSDCGLLIVDSFAGLARLQAEEENDSAAITERLRPLQEAATYEIAVLFLHHMGHHSRPRGSTAFSAVADISTRLTRTTGNTLNLRTDSRFEAPAAIKATLDKTDERSQYRLLSTSGTTSDERSDTDSQIIASLRDKAKQPGLTREEISKFGGVTVDVLKKRLPRLIIEGKVTKSGQGKRGAPYRYRAA